MWLWTALEHQQIIYLSRIGTIFSLAGHLRGLFTSSMIGPTYASERGEYDMKRFLTVIFIHVLMGFAGYFGCCSLSIPEFSLSLFYSSFIWTSYLTAADDALYNRYLVVTYFSMEVSVYLPLNLSL